MTSMDGYIRVSRVAGRSGESFISPDVQREQIEGWAKMRGVAIAAWHEDLDQSGGAVSRPGLDAMLARIDAGLTGGVVVAKLDRLSRLGVADALKLVQRITDAGGGLAALDLGIDPTTPFGEFGMTIMLGMARMERRRITDAWAVAQTRALERGAVPAPTPIGYVRGEDGVFAADPATAPIVAEAFRIAGQFGVRDAVAHLADALPDRYWSVSTLRKLFARRVYIGEIDYGGTRMDGAHPAIVSRAVFEAANAGVPAKGTRHATYPLSGLALCGCCGEPMVATSANGKPYYRCRTTTTLWRGPRCDAPASAHAAQLLDLSTAALRDALRPGHWPVGDAAPDAQAAEAQLHDAEAELDAFASDLTARRALGARYASHMQKRAEAVDEARAQLRAAGASAGMDAALVSRSDLLDSADPTELRDLCGAAFDAIVVTPGRDALASRVGYVFRGSHRLLGVSAAQDAPAGIVKAAA